MRARGKSASNLARCKSIVPSLQMQHSRAFRPELYVAHSFRAIIVDTVIAIETRILFRCRAINLERVHVARQMRKPLQLLPAPFGAPFRLPGHLSPGFSTRASLAFLSLSLSLSLSLARKQRTPNVFTRRVDTFAPKHRRRQIVR